MVRNPFLLPVVFLSAFGVFSFAWAEEPAPRAEDKQEAAFRKAVQTAEVHGIAVGRPVHYTFETWGKDKDWVKIFDILIAGKGPAAARVRECMPEALRKLTPEDRIPEKLAAELPRVSAEMSTLIGEFRYGFVEILDFPEFYHTGEAFKEVKLSKEAKQLIAVGKKRTAWQTACLNWRLMSAVFGDAIPPLPPNFRTIRVEVRGDKEVVLVLSCCNACHWQVDVNPGAKVTGVVLCGGGAQEVELTKNPVEAAIVYRAAHAIDGTRRMGPGVEYFDGFELRDDFPAKKFEVRNKFEAGMKKLLGKDFASMQRAGNTARNEPYIIDPGAKK